jgi:hypothetical protein
VASSAGQAFQPDGNVLPSEVSIPKPTSKAINDADAAGNHHSDSGRGAYWPETIVLAVC